MRLLLFLLACHGRPRSDRERACDALVEKLQIDCSRLNGANYDCALKARSSEAIELCLALKGRGGSPEFEADPSGGCQSFRRHVSEVVRSERCAN